MAGTAAGAATLRSGAATAAAAEARGSGGAGTFGRKKGGGGAAAATIAAPASPDPQPPTKRRFSTGVGALAVTAERSDAAGGGAQAPPPPKATTQDAAAAGALASALPQAFIALAVAGGAWPPTAVQGGTWAAATRGQDVLAVAPPGAGKTLAYAVPALVAALATADEKKGARGVARPAVHCTPTAVVLVPARELGTQVAAVFTRLRRGRGDGAAARVALVVGGVDRAAQAAAAKGASIVVATPGRLLDLVDAGDMDLGASGRVGLEGVGPPRTRTRARTGDEAGVFFY